MGSRGKSRMAYRSGSGSAGGSRYPSAYGHTPSYRSYNSLGSSSTSYDLPSSGGYKSDLARELARDHHKTTSFADDKFFSDSLKDFDSPLMTSSAGTGSSSSASKKVSSYSSSYSSSSGTGTGSRVP